METILEKIDNEEVNEFDLDLDVVAAPSKPAYGTTLDERGDIVLQELKAMNAQHVIAVAEFVEVVATGRNAKVVTHKSKDTFERAIHARLENRFNPPLALAEHFHPSKYLTVKSDGIVEKAELFTIMRRHGMLTSTRSSSLSDLGPDTFNEFKATRGYWIDHAPEWKTAVPVIDPRIDEVLNCLSEDREAEKIHIMQWIWWRVFGRNQFNAPALCISGAQGSGKGLLASMMETAMHGKSSVVNVTVGESFQDGFAGAGVLYLDEQSAAQKDDKWVKTYVGNGQIRINPKNATAFMADVTYQVYATSNDRKGALFLSQDVNENRRMSVLIAGQSLADRLRARGITDRLEIYAVQAGYAEAMADTQAVANLLKYVEVYHRPEALIAFHGEDYRQILGAQQTSREVDLIDLIKALDAAGYTAFKLSDAKKLINALTLDQGGKAISADAWAHIVETAEKQTGWKLYDKLQRWTFAGKDAAKGNKAMRQIMSKCPSNADSPQRLAEGDVVNKALDGTLPPTVTGDTPATPATPAPSVEKASPDEIPNWFAA